MLQAVGRMVSQNARISIDDAERQAGIDTNGYTEGWGYFLTLCSALDDRLSNPPRLELHDWAEQLLCVPEMRQVIREEHAASHNGGVVVPVPPPMRRDMHRVLKLNTLMRVHLDKFEVILTVDRSSMAFGYAHSMLNQEREAALAAARVTGAPERQVTIPLRAVPRLHSTVCATIIPGCTRRNFNYLRKRLELYLRNAAFIEPHLNLVLPAMLSELRLQFERAIPVVFT